MTTPEPAEPLVSLYSVGAIIVRRLWFISLCAVAGGALGIALGISSPEVYRSYAVFTSQGADASSSGLSAVAGRLGFSVPGMGGSGAWSSAVFVELLTSRALLERLARDTIVLAEEGGRKVQVADLWGRQVGPEPERIAKGALAIRSLFEISEDRRTNVVRVGIQTPWPSASYELVKRLVEHLNAYVIENRRWLASAELRFVEARAEEAGRQLRAAEDRLEDFLQANRATSSSPSLAFARDRLQRDVIHRQQIYSTLEQSRADAQIRELRNLDAIVVIEKPAIAAIREPRGTVGKGMLGISLGILVGVLLSLVSAQIAAARAGKADDVAEFLAAWRELVPRSIRRRMDRGR